jgi:hypothetical protein
VSNTERQRQFRERNPGYYQRLHAQRRAEVKALRAMCEAERITVEAAAVRVLAGQTVAEQVAVPVVRREMLMLPAPAEALVIPGVNAIPDKLTAALQLVELACQRTEAR